MSDLLSGGAAKTFLGKQANRHPQDLKLSIRRPSDAATSFGARGGVFKAVVSLSKRSFSTGLAYSFTIL